MQKPGINNTGKTYSKMFVLAALSKAGYAWDCKSGMLVVPCFRDREECKAANLGYH